MVEQKITNFTFSFGCSPGSGVRADTKFAQNFIDLFTDCFHITEGSIDIPTSFSQVISSDANFESITSDMAQELRIFRKDNVVANRMMIFVADGSPESDNRFEITKAFFMSELGFNDSEIIKIQRS